MLDQDEPEGCGIFVLGTYGSGSSAVAGILHRLGVMMGVKLVPPSKSNPRGHYEDRVFRKLLYQWRANTHTLRKLELFIDARFNNFKIWGVKEPAILEVIMALGPFLQHRNYKLIITQRSPIACARSYVRKWTSSDLQAVHTHIVNMLSNRQRFVDTYPQECLYVDFNELTENPKLVVQRIVKFVFGERPHIFSAKPWPSEEQVEASIDFIDPNLNHRLENE